MEKRILRWYGQAVRMESERKPKLVLGARPEGGRGKGRRRVKCHGESVIGERAIWKVSYRKMP